MKNIPWYVFKMCTIYFVFQRKGIIFSKFFTEDTLLKGETSVEFLLSFLVCPTFRYCIFRLCMAL